MKQFSLDESIAKRRIVPFSNGPKLVAKEVKSANDDLKDAKTTMSLKGYKWATIQAYYSIFHSSRALLYAKRYREKSHIHLGNAIKALYVDTNHLPISYYDNFIDANTLRELADYKSTFSKAGAERVIRGAEEVLDQTKNLLKKK